MIKTKNQITQNTKENKDGKVKLYLSNLKDFDGKNPKLNMYAHAELEVGEELEYHIHTGESETYYILSGKGLYNDNGTLTEIEAGTVTFTPSGSGHGIKNIGNEKLCFMALILSD